MSLTHYFVDINFVDLVGVEPSENNGTEGSLHHILKDPPILKQADSLPYTSCEYPKNETVYERRADLVTSKCTCNPPNVCCYTVHYVKHLYINIASRGLFHMVTETSLKYMLPYAVPLLNKFLNNLF